MYCTATSQVHNRLKTALDHISQCGCVLAPCCKELRPIASAIDDLAPQYIRNVSLKHKKPMPWTIATFAS